jgi:hypothetical protein
MGRKKYPQEGTVLFINLGYFKVPLVLVCQACFFTTQKPAAMRTLSFVLLITSLLVLPTSRLAAQSCQIGAAAMGELTYNALLLNGTNLFGATNAGLFVSGDKGQTWQPVANPELRYAEVRQLATSGVYMYAATFGRGLYRSSDNGYTWQRVNLGYNARFFHSLAAAGSTLVASAGKDGLFLSSDNGANWTRREATGPYALWPNMITNAADMREAYNMALANGNACLLFSLAVIENTHRYLSNTKAGDILSQSYRLALQQNNAPLLFEIARFENSAGIMQEKAGDILSAAYNEAMRQQQARLLFEMARYENTAQINDLKAGDILARAYRFASAQMDQQLLFDLARYENEYSLINDVTAGTILQQAYLAAVQHKDYATLYLLADYETDVNLLTDMSGEDIRRKARIIQMGG